MSAHLLIRADATPRMGTGHVMRCLALAQAAQGLGMDVRFLARVEVPWVQERLRAERMPLAELDDAVPREESPDVLLNHLARTNCAPSDTWVVLDGYHFTFACQRAVQGAGYRLLVIDDYAHLPEYSADLLLNQNPGAEDLPYMGKIGQKLLGPKFALLRREFREARAREAHVASLLSPGNISEQTYRDQPCRNILMTLGGGDFIEYLEAVAREMNIPAMNDCTIRVVQGAMNAERIRLAFANCPARLDILPRVHDMPALLLDTDLCITAGGSTCWELCCLGVPFLTVEVAENQHKVIDWLLRCRLTHMFSRESLKFYLAHPLIRTQKAQVGQNLVNGNGAERVISSLLTANSEGRKSCGSC